MGKSIVKLILDNHRNIALYKRAMTDIVLMLSSDNTHFTYQKYKEIPEMSYIKREIEKLKSRLASLGELQPAQYERSKCGNDTPCD